jgi:prepilin-type N-terminal cleavage/methylation domain-containing protein
MKGRSTLRRRYRSARGFTLLELMVVITLVAILAAIAVPKMAVARNDRLAFDYARQTSELFHNARARAMGRGSAADSPCDCPLLSAEFRLTPRPRPMASVKPRSSA